MSIICGADGCTAGWIVLTQDLDTGCISWRLATDARNLVGAEPYPQVIALDIPIGLPDRGPRACDMEARQLLGPGRASSVFPAPIRLVLDAGSYEDACQRRFQAEGKKMSHQAWGIVDKIRDVDDMLRQNPALRLIIHEVHPEVSFYYLAGHPMRHGKKTRAGKEERQSLLEPIFGHRLQAALADQRRLAASEDDVLDAFAALWTARRIALHTCRTLPAVPGVDSVGLSMHIAA